MTLLCTNIPKKSRLRWNSTSKMTMYLSSKSIFVRSIFIVLVLESCLVTTVFSKQSSIVFENKVYKNVLLAIDSSIEISTCEQLIGDVQKSLQSLSSKMKVATDEKAWVGSVDILLPWTANDIKINCGNVTFERAKMFQTYDYADIKITNHHPIANSLPWTKQYRGCGHESESIYIPPEFLSTATITENIKGNFLLHEWAKFRYGVFEEFGYFNDEFYSPCYPKNGHSNFTGCSDSAVQTAIGEGPASPSPDDCKTMANANSDRIKEELNRGTSSIMATPQLENVERFCSSNTHNRFAPTKHNFMCDRKSVSEVIFSHRDFNVTKSNAVFQNNDIIFKFIQEDTRNNGYAFIIEDSDNIRISGRLKIIKQAITEMTNFMDSVNEVVLIRFNGNVRVEPIYSKVLINETDKIEFINQLPDQLTKALNLSTPNRRFMSKTIQTSVILQRAYDYLKTHSSFRHKIILLGSDSPAETNEAIELTKTVSGYSLSIATFDHSSEWLKWNTIPHTERVLFLPPCENAQCNGKLTSILTDSLLEILGNSRPRKFFTKIADISLSGMDPVSFRIDGPVKRFVAVFPTFGPIPENLQLPILSSSGQSCTASKMLNYDNLFSIDTDRASCNIMAGTWNLNLSDRSYFSFLQIYAEITPGINNLVITTALGHTVEDEILPTKNIVPVYASVSNSSDHPIINADVTLDLFITDVPSATLTLLDDGHYPDVTKNDGVYSAILSNYSPTPAAHLGRINVKTTTDTKKIVSLSSSGNAALLGPEFSTKCCGNEVPLEGGVQDVVGESFYSTFIPSFKTLEDFTAPELPPAKIQSIGLAENSTESTTVFQFVAPDRVHHYEVCCFHESEDLNCTAIPQTKDCGPVEAGATQICSIQKSQLREVVNGVIGIINCGIRGVSSKNSPGDLSGNFLEIDLRNTDTEGNNKCDSISDGCLPIYIFWILIGCVAALVLTIVIGLIILCVCRSGSSDKKKKTPPTPHNRNITGKFPDKDSPLYNVYVNQAYIQDSDGQLKLVAADGELLPYEPNTNEQRMEDQGYATQNSVPQSPALGKHGMPPAVRRRSISANAVERDNFSSFKDNNDTLGRKHVSWNSNNDDMNPTGTGLNRNSNYTDDYPEPYGQTFPNESNLSQGNSRSQDFITVVPKPRDRFQKPFAGYANPGMTQSTRSETTTMTPVPSLSSNVEAQNRNHFLNNNADDDGSLGPIYASVSRNGHRPISNNTQSNAPVFNRFGLGNHPTLNPIVPKKPQNSAKSNTAEMGDNQLGNGRFTRGYNNPSRKSVRLDAFPSSESETYSDISRGIPIPPAPPLPPPLPSAGDLNRTTLPRTAAGRETMSHRTNGDGSDRMDRNSSRTALRQPPATSAPISTSRSPPVDNSFLGIKTHLEQHMKNKNLNRPPPPPRHDKLPISSVSSFGSKAVEMGQVNQDDGEDENSDFWDDGDEYDDYNQGQSFA